MQADALTGNINFFSGPATKPPRPAQLPRTGMLCRREEEMAALRSLLTHDAGAQGPLAVIDGPAGIGKTALAIGFAREVADRFPDAQLFVDLRGFDLHGAPRSAGSALSGFLRSLGVDAGGIPHDVDEQAGLYRSLLADKKALIVLDNASTPDQVRPLLPGTPSCLALVTGRNRLPGLIGREDALPVSLHPMSVDDGTATLARLLGYAEVTRHPDAARRLVRLCGGLPLALRVVAARIRSRTGSTIRDCLQELEEDDPLDGLEMDGDASLNVRAVFSLSYRGISGNEARCFRTLAQHPSNEFGLPAAAALLAVRPRQAKHALSRLVERNLLQEIRPERYRFHDLLLLYARERSVLDDDESARDAALRRSLDWYLHTADAAASHLSPRMHRVPAGDCPSECRPLTFTDHRGALEWIEHEEETLIAAMHRAAAHGVHEFVQRLPVVLSRYCFLRKPWTTWLEPCHLGLAHARADTEPTWAVWLRVMLGIAARDQGRPDHAIGHCLRAHAMAQHAGDVPGRAWSLVILGLAHRDTGRLHIADPLCREASELFASADDHHGLAWAQTIIGLAEQATGREESSSQRFENALTGFLSADDPSGAAWSSIFLARSARLSKRYTDARKQCEHALELADASGDHKAAIWTLHELGTADLQDGNVERAIAGYQRALTLSRDVVDHYAEARTLDKIATALCQASRHAEARDAWTHAVSILDRLNSPHAHQTRQRRDEQLNE
ncbi:tetratricopeptide repeat protein [Saccharopolyspora sp. SCSIO 74807]|uniref:ATP-binding protein n=1 Tax=Saccharopolyspora sp. SCSIO 74807 TaxID=3118084 RepID=UPI0030D4C398